jgi:hypothetical protein
MGTHQLEEVRYRSFGELKAVIILVVFWFCLAGTDILVICVDCVCNVPSALSQIYILEMPLKSFSCLQSLLSLVGARDLRPLGSHPVSLNLVHVLDFLETLNFFIFLFLCVFYFRYYFV